MKFIDGIKDFKIENNSITLTLPYYHRAATGLLSGVEVYVFPKISTIKNAAGQETQVKEIIISPFHPNDWFNIYELDLIMDDQPGLINSISKILKNKKINIHIQESLITNDEQNFSVSLIVDVKEYKSILKSDGEIDIHMHKDLSESFTEIGIKLEKFLPCKQLRNNSKEIQQNKQTNFVDLDTLFHFYSTSYHPIQIVNKRLIFGKQIIQALFQDYDTNDEIQGTIFSDTNEKMIIVRFFNKDQHIVHFDIQHDNKLGAIFNYSTLIKETSNNYNIVSCYNRIENSTETAHWYVLLDVSYDVEKLLTLFNNFTTSAKYFQKLMIHSYSRSINNLSLNSLNKQFPSQLSLFKERKEKEMHIDQNLKYQEVVYNIERIKTEFLKETSSIKDQLLENKTIVRKTRTQFWIVSLLITLISSYVLIRIIPKSDLQNFYFIIAGIAGGLMTIIHIFVFYFEAPKLIKKLTGKKEE